MPRLLVIDFGGAFGVGAAEAANSGGVHAGAAQPDVVFKNERADRHGAAGDKYGAAARRRAGIDGRLRSCRVAGVVQFCPEIAHVKPRRPRAELLPDAAADVGGQCRRLPGDAWAGGMRPDAYECAGLKRDNVFETVGRLRRPAAAHNRERAAQAAVIIVLHT